MKRKDKQRKRTTIAVVVLVLTDCVSRYLIRNIIANLTQKSNSKTTVKVGKTKVFGGFVVLVIDTNKSTKT